MADSDRTQQVPPAEPPGGGRQDHDTMRTAATLPVSGPASSDTLAAGGGLELPGRETRPAASHTVHVHGTPVHEPIPGERDPGTLTHREPGAMGGGYAGTDVPASSGPPAPDEDDDRP